MKYFICVVLYLSFSFVSFGNCIEGSGVIIEDKIYLPSVNSIEVNVPLNLVLTPSNDESILVKSNKEILENLEFKYEDRELVISSRKEICPKDLTVFVSLRQINSIEINAVCKLTSTGKFESEDFELDVSGSADIDFSIDAEEIDIEFDGSGSLNLSGSSEFLEISLSGNGKIDANNLVSDEINVSLDGNGEIKVNPLNSLKADLKGNGRILYKNKPEKLELEKDGNGLIEKMK